MKRSFHFSIYNKHLYSLESFYNSLSQGKKYFFIVDYDVGLFSGKWKLTETTENGFQGSLN